MLATRLSPHCILTPPLCVLSVQSGIEFTVSPAIPNNGLAPGIGQSYTFSKIYISAPEPMAVLTDGVYVNLPVVNLQQQMYMLA